MSLIYINQEDKPFREDASNAILLGFDAESGKLFCDSYADGFKTCACLGGPAVIARNLKSEIIEKFPELAVELGFLKNDVG